MRCAGTSLRARIDRVKFIFPRLLAAALALTFPLAVAVSARASDAQDANRGLKLGFGPILLVPTDGGPLGGGLILDGRYGIDLGPVIVAPGARAAGYILSERFLGMLTPTARVTVPLGPLAPFVMGGVGPGLITNPSEHGVALLAGGGLMIHVGRFLAFGAEATYQTITDTEFKSLAIGPSLSLGL